MGLWWGIQRERGHWENREDNIKMDLQEMGWGTGLTSIRIGTDGRVL